MSMLAERKQKQKWSLNPRGKAWSEDTSKFGFKMLEKMGWSKGKGLGAKEDGVVEHIKVSHKADSKGLGFKEDNEQWTKHDVDFNSLLQNLSTSTDTNIEITTNTINSLEKKSQSSKVRVHYHKFTRGKDLSRYSAKDLANIFGKKSLSNSENVISISKTDNYSDTTEEINVEISVDNCNGAESVEPKKKKLKRSKNEDEIAGKTNLAFNTVIDINGTINNDLNEDNNKLEVKKKKKKSKKDKEIKNGEGINRSDQNETIRTTDNESDGKKKKDKKKKKRKREFESIDNPAFDPISNKDSLGNNCEYEIPNKKIKKSKKNPSDNGLTNPAFDDQPSFHLSELSQENHQSMEINENSKSQKKKSKRNEEDLGVNNSAFDPLSTESTIENNLMEIEIPKEKKKKSKKTSDESVGINNSAFDPLSTESAIENNLMEIEVPKEKKKKKSPKKSCDKTGDLGINNSVFNSLSTALETENNQMEIEVTKEKKKKKSPKSNSDENLGINNSAFDPLSTESTIENNQMEVEITKEKKKKKSKKNSDETGDLGINNSAFDPLSTESTIENNLMEIEITKEKKNKSKKSKEINLGLNNPAFDCQINEEATPNDESSKKNKKKRKLEEIHDENEETSSTPKQDKKKKKKSKEEKSELDATTTTNHLDEITNIECDLTLNVTTTPIIKKPNSDNTGPNNKKMRKKNVRFSNVTREHIIPNNEELRLEANGNFDRVEENVKAISNRIDGYQIELENDINEAKDKGFMVGIVGNEDGENEKLEDGTVLLKYKYATFGKDPSWRKKDISNAKQSYKHLIKGDINLGFKNTNLHTIEGYKFWK